MSRIAGRFQTMRNNGRKGFIPFVTAGDPDLATSMSIILKLAELGADVVELGVPFSDPMADGPTIQRSSERSLIRGTSLQNVIDLASKFRSRSEVPLVLFSYLNPILRYGTERFAAAAQKAGIDGVLFTDVIDREAAELSTRFAKHDIELISLIAPTTTDERLELICANSRGFVYAVSRAGVTGARESISDTAEVLVDRAREFTDLPIAVGFGISTREQISEVWKYADAAVVGSAIVAEIEKRPEDAVAAVDSFVTALLPQFAKSGTET